MAVDLINGRTPEEIKRGLRWIAHDCDDNGEDCSECECVEECHKLVEDDVARDALAYIERLEAERNAALAKVPKWISVKERLPEHRQRAYVRAKDGFCFESVYIDPVGFERYEIGEGWINENKNVTHWMPLPEPSEEDE